MAQSRFMTARTRRSRGLVALVAALVVAACGPAAPSPSPATTAPASTARPTSTVPATERPSASATSSVCDDSVVGSPTATSDANDPNAGTYADIESQVEELRGLTATTPVERGLFDTAGLCAYLRESFRKDNPEDLVRSTEVLYKELGLLPQDASLEQLYLDLLTSQVAGLYDDDTKHMYVVSQSGAIGPTEEITYAHEYTHALQDQRFVLKDVIGDATDQGDRTMAKLTVVEGDATLVMTLWAQRYLTPAELSQIAGSVDPASQAILDGMPSILRDPLEFPYLQGLQLTLGAFSSGGFDAVNDLFTNPPDSTEQILHPAKLQAREQPVDVTFPDDLATRLGAGWKVAAQDTFGELLLGILLRNADGADRDLRRRRGLGW